MLLERKQSDLRSWAEPRATPAGRPSLDGGLRGPPGGKRRARKRLNDTSDWARLGTAQETGIHTYPKKARYIELCISCRTGVKRNTPVKGVTGYAVIPFF